MAQTPLLMLLVLVSGLAGLMYEVLWLRDLQLLFGNTAYSAASVLAAFFLGQAAGGLVWGRRVSRARRPLWTYAGLEAGIAASVGLYLAAPRLLAGCFGPAYACVEHSLPLVLGLKFSVALGVLFVPCFLMGGTLPALGQHLVCSPERLGRTGSLLYAVNTLGAVAGAVAAGFLLPPRIGCAAMYGLAIGANLLVAAAAWTLGRRCPPTAVAPIEPPAAAAVAPSLPHNVLSGLAFASGLLALSLEVLWTRMFAQVLENSVYAFAAILVVFLIALALGSALAHAMCRVRAAPVSILVALLSAGGVAVAASPHVLHLLTPRFQAIEAAGTWHQYVAALLAHVAAVVLVPGVLIGSVLPFLLRLAESWHANPGRVLGELLSLNMAGAICGSLLTGFWLIGTVGQRGSLTAVAGCYAALALLALFFVRRIGNPSNASESSTARFRRGCLGSDWKSALRRGVMPVAAGVLVTMLARGPLRVVWTDGDSDEQLLEVREGSHATVAVTRDENGSLNIRVNSTYLLGGSEYAEGARALAQIPLLLHPAPQRIFMIGMGTGITAGGTLDFPVERVVVAEYVPEVVAAVRRHFRPYVNGLLDDPRVRIVCEDGRNALRWKPDQYDVILGDLVYPELASSLFAREHFAVVASRLAPDGIFAQWIPLYQLTEREFRIVVRTMLEVFPAVTLWRGDAVADCPAVALIASNQVQPLDPAMVARNLQRLARRLRPTRSWEAVPYLYYAGNLRAAAAMFECPVNTDDRPLIEYLAPQSARNGVDGDSPWFTSYPLLRFYDALAEGVAPERDPYLRRLSDTQRAQVREGLEQYRAAVLDSSGL